MGPNKNGSGRFNTQKISVPSVAKPSVIDFFINMAGWVFRLVKTWIPGSLICIQMYTIYKCELHDYQDDPIQPGPQGDSAYQNLLEEIRNGTLLPGDRLRKIEASDHLGVNRTPIREAIRRREADGLVTQAPRLGTTVRSLNYAEVMELYELRAVLEGTAARLAARAASNVELDELELLNDRLAEAGTGPDAVRINRICHATLLDAT